MRSTHRLCLSSPFPIIVSLIVFPFIASTQDPAIPDPYEWVIETYQLPAPELVGGFASAERGALIAPPAPAPAPDASGEEIQEFIKKSSSIVTHYFETQGLALPKGSMIVYDPETMTLAARLPRIAHASVAFTTEAYLQVVDTFVELSPAVIEAPAATVRALVARAGKKADHTDLLRELEGEVARGNAKFISRTRIDGRSGLRSKVAQVRETAYPVEFSVGPDGTVEYEEEFFPEGTTWEVDPVVGADGETVDLNIALNYNFAPSARRKLPLTTAEDRSVAVRSVDTFRSTLTSQYTIMNGTARMMGAWKPATVLQPAADDILHAAFVTVDVVRVLPLPNPNLAEYLREHGDAVEPIPEGELEFEKAADEIPEGMVVRRFKVPPTYLSAGSAGRSRAGGGGADPFAAPVNEPTFSIKATAQDILESAGIVFPKGSSANYLPATSTLVVRNTPENIVLVEAYIMSIVSGVERSIGVTAHLVQAPGALLREAVQNTRGLPDHIAEWERLQTQEGFSILSTNWIEARSGQRASIEVNGEIPYPSSAFLDWKGKSGNGKEAAAIVRPEPILTGTFESNEIGTNIEVDPLLGADGTTVDIGVTVDYDYAPPITTAPPAAAEEGELVLDGPTTVVHQAEITTTTTMLSDMIRLIGIWQPEGTPEFDNADILQAVFLKVNVVPVRDELE